MTKTSSSYGVIYLITCLVSGKKYVGQTTKTLEQRWKEHRKNRGKKPGLSGAISKHGSENFKIELLEEGTSLQDLFVKEIFWISKLGTLAPNGYNLTQGGEGSAPELRLGVTRPEAVKRKISETLRSRFPNGFGYRPSPTHIEKLASLHRGRKRSPETRAKMKAAWDARRERKGLPSPDPRLPGRSTESRERSRVALTVSWAKKVSPKRKSLLDETELRVLWSSLDALGLRRIELAKKLGVSLGSLRNYMHAGRALPPELIPIAKNLAGIT